MHPLTCHSHADISPGVKLPDGFAGQDGEAEENALPRAERLARQMAAINCSSFIFRRRRVEREVIRFEFGVHLQQHGEGSGSVGFEFVQFHIKTILQDPVDALGKSFFFFFLKI